MNDLLLPAVAAVSRAEPNRPLTKISVPPFVRPSGRQWGSSGQSYSAYLASLVDLEDLTGARILLIDNTADLLHEIAERRCTPGAVVAVESDRVAAAFYVSLIKGSPTTLLVGDLDDPDSRLHRRLSMLDPFDIVVIGADPNNQTDDRLRASLALARGLTAPDAKLVCGCCLNEDTPGGNVATTLVRGVGMVVEDVDYQTFDFGTGTLALHSRTGLMNIAADSGWKVVEIREPRRTLQHHFVAVPAST